MKKYYSAHQRKGFRILESFGFDVSKREWIGIDKDVPYLRWHSGLSVLIVWFYPGSESFYMHLMSGEQFETVYSVTCEKTNTLPYHILRAAECLKCLDINLSDLTDKTI